MESKTVHQALDLVPVQIRRRARQILADDESLDVVTRQKVVYQVQKRVVISQTVRLDHHGDESVFGGNGLKTFVHLLRGFSREGGYEPGDIYAGERVVQRVEQGDEGRIHVGGRGFGADMLHQRRELGQLVGGDRALRGWSPVGSQDSGRRWYVVVGRIETVHQALYLVPVQIPGRARQVRADDESLDVVTRQVVTLVSDSP